MTIHPSAVLRAGARRREMRGQLVSDLAVARDALLAPTRVGDGRHA